mgnify:CR=1 FL=1
MHFSPWPLRFYILMNGVVVSSKLLIHVHITGMTVMCGTDAMEPSQHAQFVIFYHCLSCSLAGLPSLTRFPYV